MGNAKRVADRIIVERAARRAAPQHHHRPAQIAQGESAVQHAEMRREATIPDDRYADGGAPYTDQGTYSHCQSCRRRVPTNDLVSVDRGVGDGGLMSVCPDCTGRRAAIARRIIAESEGARRERETHELQQQFEDPAWSGDNRKPQLGQQNVETVRKLDRMETEAYSTMTNLFKDDTPFAMVMPAAVGVGDMDNERTMLQASKAIAAGQPAAREWFSRAAVAIEAYLDAQRATVEADPDGIRYNGFKPK